MARLKKLLTSAGCLVLAVASVLAQSTPSETDRSGPTQKQIEHDPLTISASEIGRFSKGFSWTLHVDPSGKAKLTIKSFSHPKTREFEISKKQLDELRTAVVRERFFELAGRYGQVVSDGSTTTLTISVGARTKTIVLQFLMNWVHDQDAAAKLQEPSRAIRVLNVIRGWFSDPEAVDLRKYDRMVLDAAARGESAK
jgi:hypothetical protein